jgi:surface antigen
MPEARSIAIALVALTLGGCANDPGSGARQVEGTTLGAITSSLFSTAQSNAGSGVTGSIDGATAGGILSGPAGASLDDRDRRRAYAAEKQALEQGQPGEPVGWRGSGGRHGTVVPGVIYEVRGTRCRDYTHSIYIDGRPQTGRTTACRNPDGSWSPVG